MQVMFNTRLVASLVAGLHLFVALLATTPTMALAQNLDIDPPVIEFEPIGSGNRGDSQVFAATVVDNVEVASVKIYFRFTEESPYQIKDMELLGASGIYTLKLEVEDLPADAMFIQYYLEAHDSAGNRALQGFAFDPIERALVEPTPLTTEVAAQEPVKSGGLSFNQKLIIGVVGVLALGVLASASGGGGSSEPGVPVTIVVDQLP